MEKSTRSFLSGIIDYAGLYPPASLSLDEAYHKFVDHKKSLHKWMLSNFVIGQSKLKELSELSQNNDPGHVPVSVVANPSNTIAEFKAVVDECVKQIKSVDNLEANLLEIKLPTKIFSGFDEDVLLEILDYAAVKMSASPKLPRMIFFEIPGFDFNSESAEKVIEALSIHNSNLKRKNLEHYANSGFKIRCGGVEAFQFPSVEYLSGAIFASRKYEVPVKFTAGLHHPIRHFNESVQTKMHGFLNVFGASILSYTENLFEEDIQAILGDEDPAHFSFSGEFFSWKSLKVSLSEIEKLRKAQVTSYGSCSFEEPVEDLQTLNILQ